MDKIKQITIKLQRWQAGMLVAALAILLSYLLAATMPDHKGGITAFHFMGMIAAGIAGTVVFVVSFLEMWEKWDGED